MFKAKTVIAILFSLLMGLLAVKGVALVKKDTAVPAPQPVAESVKPGIAEHGTITAPAAVDFSAGIPRGMRIVTIRVDDVSGVSRSLEKNDRVDVVAVTDFQDGQKGSISRMVLQNIRIFDIEKTAFKKSLTDKGSRKKKNWSIHLLVTPDQGTVLASVGEAARLRLLLRNRDDTGIRGAVPMIYTTRNGLVTIRDGHVNPAGRIRPGMRAISIEIDNNDGICGTLEPGDRVDLIFSCMESLFTTEGGNSAAGTQGMMSGHRKSSRIILQDVEVLATEGSLDASLGNTRKSRFLTLVVTPKEAETVAVVTDASKSGKFRVVARNPGDRRRIHSRGELFTDLVIKDKRPYKMVEILKGTAKYPVKFYED
ncbi:MAG: Flp pilus assembly protein CpaB [Desulfobacter sp.]|nr:MAG: Flp pilus assembly protein CpaB [Desulfobacter sp.]